MSLPSRWILVLALSLSIGSLWLSYLDESLPSTRLSDVFSTVSSDEYSDSRSSVPPARPQTPKQTVKPSEPYTALRVKKIIPLSDNGVRLNKSMRGLVWKLAVSSQIFVHRNKQPSNVSNPRIALKNGTNCSVLCGKHGWGYCKPTGCLCPVLFRTTECLSAVTFPKMGPLSGMEAQYLGEIILSRKYMSRQSEVLSFIPEKFLEGSKYVIKLGKVTSQFLDILPVADILQPGKVFDSCAIVGSSGVLTGYRLGSVIDGNQWVVRFNSAPTKGFEAHVGKKTSLRITNSLNWGFMENHTEVVVVPLRTPPSLRALIRARSKFKRLKLVALNPVFLKHISLSFEFVPSVGMLGVMLALQRCARVSLFGFHSYKEQGVSYHYFDRCAVPSNRERDQREYEILAAMVKEGYVRFGDPCVKLCHEAPKRCAACQLSHGYKQPLANASSSATSDCPPCSRTVDGCRNDRSLVVNSKKSTWNRIGASNSLDSLVEDGKETEAQPGSLFSDEVDEFGEIRVQGESGLKLLSEKEVLQLAIKRMKEVWVNRTGYPSN